MIGKLRLLFWIGIVMLFLPFLGISNIWKEVLAMIIGLILILMSMRLRKNYRAMRSIIRNLEHSIVQEAIQPEPDPLPTPSPEQPYA